MLKLKCKICEHEFLPAIDKHYTSRDNKEAGLTTIVKDVEGNLYDTFDCPTCGCQMIVQERKRVYISNKSFLDDIGKEKESEERNDEA